MFNYISDFGLIIKDISITYQKMFEVIGRAAALVLEEGAKTDRCGCFVQHDSDENDHSKALVLAETLKIERRAQGSSISQ